MTLQSFHVLNWKPGWHSSHTRQIPMEFTEMLPLIPWNTFMVENVEITLWSLCHLTCLIYACILFQYVLGTHLVTVEPWCFLFFFVSVGAVGDYPLLLVGYRAQCYHPGTGFRLVCGAGFSSHLNNNPCSVFFCFYITCLLQLVQHIINCIFI